MDYEHFMNKALNQAREAFAAGEFPVGCVIVYRDQILSNGSRVGTAGELPNEVDHAEMIALRRLAAMNRPVDSNNLTIFSTLEPCLMCFGAILLNGIGKIVYAYEDVMGGATGCDTKHLRPLYRNHRISIIKNILRKESLNLLKAYFADPKNTYWRGSYLAEYTLKQ
jgi:tRNA(adenine34) deaminase